MNDERDDTETQSTGNPGPSCRRAFLDADFFAHMLDYQAATTAMLDKIRAAEVAADKAVKAAQDPENNNEYLERLKKGRRRLELQRALSDEELEEVQRDLENMPPSVRQYLTDQADTSTTESTVKPPAGPGFSP